MNLYHYTDLNAVHSILDSHKIRMTDIRFLNDKSEYMQGLEILREASLQEDLILSIKDNYFRKSLQVWFKRAFEELFDFENASEMFYVASFSRSSNTLSQWRSYGMLAIQFDYDEMEGIMRERIIEHYNKCSELLKIELIECHYVSNRDTAVKKALELINEKLIPTIEEWWQADVPIEQNEHIYIDIKEILSMLATAFKHASFIEEQEFRLVISVDITSENVKFRAKNNVLIPFYELDIIPDVIKGIIIGPVENQKITAHSLDIFNLHRAKKLNNDMYQLSIIKSDIPYRML